VDRTDQSHFYADPVVYDILHAPGTADEARVVQTLARRSCGHARALTLLEPACGTGRYLRALAKNGHRGIGFDLSGAMIDDARERAERAGLLKRLTLFTADMTDFADAVPRGVGPADAAFNLINTIRHLHTDDAVRKHLAEVSRCLTPRGVYLVGLSVTDYDLEQPSEDVWVGARGPCRVMQTVNYVPPDRSAGGPGDRTETVLSHLHIRTPGGEEHRDSRYTLRTYTLGEWTRLIDTSPMRIERVDDDAGEEIDPPTLGYALFVLRPR
jgi:SAM-dependent methyltransferase